MFECRRTGLGYQFFLRKGLIEVYLEGRPDLRLDKDAPERRNRLQEAIVSAVLSIYAKYREALSCIVAFEVLFGGGNEDLRYDALCVRFGNDVCIDIAERP